jgi:hypothetical protein
MRSTICALLIAVAGDSFAADTNVSAEAGSELLRHLDTLNSLTRSQMQLDYEKLRNEIHNELLEIKSENAVLRSRLDRQDGDMGNYIDAISWVSGIVIGFVGILFGIGAFILYRENQGVTRKAQEQLESWNERAANLETTFDLWFQDAKKDTPPNWINWAVSCVLKCYWISKTHRPRISTPISRHSTHTQSWNISPSSRK